MNERDGRRSEPGDSGSGPDSSTGSAYLSAPGGRLATAEPGQHEDEPLRRKEPTDEDDDDADDGSDSDPGRGDPSDPSLPSLPSDTDEVEELRVGGSALQPS